MAENEALERKVIALIAADRLDIPVSSMSGKLKRMKPKLADQICLPDSMTSFNGERVYARVEYDTENKAKGMKEGVEEFSRQFPKYGAILRGMIESERAVRETNLYFGVNEGRRLTAEDYLNVMSDLGFGPASAQNLYHELIEVSRNIARKRDEERSIMLGTTLG